MCGREGNCMHNFVRQPEERDNVEAWKWNGKPCLGGGEGRVHLAQDRDE